MKGRPKKNLTKPPMDSPLEVDERKRLSSLEKRIHDGLQGFVEVGRALCEIREMRLYRSTHDRFEDYVKARFDIGKSYAYRLIQGSEVAMRITDVSNEAQARALHRIPYAEQEKAWERAKETASFEGRHATAQDIERVSAEPSSMTARPDRVSAQPWKLDQETPLFHDVLVIVTELRDHLVMLANDPQGCWVAPHVENCETWLKNIRSVVTSAKPEGPCPLCIGLDTKCEACRGRGWLPKQRLEAVRRSCQKGEAFDMEE